VEAARELVRDDVTAARASYDRALASVPAIASVIRDGIRDQIALSLAAAESRWADLEAVARRLLEEIPRLQDQANNTPEVVQLLVVALLEQGKVDEARAELGRQAAVVKRAARDDVVRRDGFEVLEARLLAASGKPADVSEAERRIGAVIARANHAGLVRLELTSALVLGRIQLQAGRTAAGRASLEAVARDARARGAVMFARSAEKALANRGKL
jgi:hypothetical protein